MHIPVIVRVSIPLIKYPNKINLGRKASTSYSKSQLTLHCPRKSEQQLKQDRNLETGTETEAMKGCLLSVIGQFAFFHNQGLLSQCYYCPQWPALTCLQANLGEIPHFTLPFLGGSSLRWVNKKLNSTSDPLVNLTCKHTTIKL